MIMDKSTNLRKTVFNLVVTPLFLVFFVGCEKEESDGLISGRCGLKGERVECNEDKDCSDNWSTTSCDEYGWCSPDRSCGNYGKECGVSTGVYCNIMGECMSACETHDDCENGICHCREGGSICIRFYCSHGECPDFTEPVDGTRICKPKEEYLEGECHSPVCGDGYEQVGEQGCVKID